MCWGQVRASWNIQKVTNSSQIMKPEEWVLLCPEYQEPEHLHMLYERV